MSELTQQPEKRVKNMKNSQVRIPWLFVVSLLITIFIASRAWGVLEKRSGAREMNKAYKDELLELQKKEESMQQDLAELQTPAGVEREIREKFRVTKPGEELVVVVPSNNTADELADEEKGMFQFLRKIFK